MKKILLAVLLLFPALLFSQIRITGTVVEKESKIPISYASIAIPNKNIGTISDFNGNFSFYVADTVVNKTIIFSCLGFQREEIAINKIGKNAKIYLKESVIDLSGVEVTAMPYQALLNLINKVFKKAQTDKKEFDCKLFYSLESSNEDEPLELIEAFCSAKQCMDLGVTEMKMKNGRIGANMQTEKNFMSLSSTNIIVNFNPFLPAENTVGLPAVPSNYSQWEMTDQFLFWEDGLMKEDTSTLQKISFRSKEEPKIEGSILFYKNSLLLKQYEMWFYNTNKVIFPIKKNDKIDSVDIHLVYNYKKNDSNPDQMLLEHIDMDYSLIYYNSIDDNEFAVNTNLFFLFYDYENPFEPPIFKDVKLYSDYVKIWTFPLMDKFWEYNYFLPQNEKKEEHLKFFEKHGIIKSVDEVQFNQYIRELQSPLRTWSKERIDLERMSVNSMFSSEDVGDEVFDVKKMRMSNKQYNIDAQIFVNYFCVNDSLFFSTKTLINLDKSYFLPTPNAYAAAFVNMYFDLYEMSRRNLEKNLQQSATCSPNEIKDIYNKEIKQLNKNIKKFIAETKQAMNVDGLMYWYKIINDSLQINESLLEEKMPLNYFNENVIGVFPAYFHNTGMILIKLGQFEEAVQYLTKSIEKQQLGKAKNRASSYYYRAMAYYYLGEFELFCNDLQKVIEFEGTTEETTELMKFCK